MYTFFGFHSSRSSVSLSLKTTWPSPYRRASLNKGLLRVSWPFTSSLHPTTSSFCHLASHHMVHVPSGAPAPSSPPGWPAHCSLDRGLCGGHGTWSHLSALPGHLASAAGGTSHTWPLLRRTLGRLLHTALVLGPSAIRRL